jgi:beta-lysine 5,6-aminomutase beta subunit
VSRKKIVRPYGDTTGDGMVQVSFTLPVPHDKRAEGAALQLAQKMGMDPAMVVHAKAMGPDFTFFVVYGSVSHLVDLSAVKVVEREYPLLSAKEVNAAVKTRLRRKLVVIGACIGTDAHTVGIDAILNVKGFAGEKGLEYYREVKVVNLGAQVLVPELVARAREEKADAVLVSQVVTQRDAHLKNTREMSAAFREAYPAAATHTGTVPPVRAQWLCGRRLPPHAATHALTPLPSPVSSLALGQPAVRPGAGDVSRASLFPESSPELA